MPIISPFTSARIAAHAYPAIDGVASSNEQHSNVKAVAKEPSIASPANVHSIALHPLAPLLRLLAHKCELATRALAAPTPTSPASGAADTQAITASSPGARAALKSEPNHYAIGRSEAALGMGINCRTNANVLHIGADAAQIRNTRASNEAPGPALTSSSSVDEDILHFARIVHTPFRSNRISYYLE